MTAPRPSAMLAKRLDSIQDTLTDYSITLNRMVELCETLDREKGVNRQAMRDMRTRQGMLIEQLLQCEKRLTSLEGPTIGGVRVS